MEGTERLLWTAAEVADVLGLSESTVEKWASQHKGPPCVKVGGRLRWRPRDVTAWIDDLPTEEPKSTLRGW